MYFDPFPSSLALFYVVYEYCWISRNLEWLCSLRQFGWQAEWMDGSFMIFLASLSRLKCVAKKEIVTASSGINKFVLNGHLTVEYRGNEN